MIFNKENYQGKFINHNPVGWFEIDINDTAGELVGYLVILDIKSADNEPEQKIPLDWQKALAVPLDAHSVWRDTTTKQVTTRAK